MSTWTYSFSQLSLWRTCKRRYYHRYVLGQPEPTTPAMRFGTLVHDAIETYLQDDGLSVDWQATWEALWANFLAEIGESESFDDPCYNLKNAKRCLDLYKQYPLEGKVTSVEEPYYVAFAEGFRYVSKPDFVVGVDEPYPTSLDNPPVTWKLYRKTVDIKTTTSFKVVAPLLPYDDQLLGQALAAGADAFCRYTFPIDRKTGHVGEPVIEECPVDPIQAERWRGETLAEILEIESWRKKTGASWPKNSDACRAYSRDCPYIRSCSYGG